MMLLAATETELGIANRLALLVIDPPHRAPWRFCCGPARRRQAWRSAATVSRIRSQWPNTSLTIRGDGHYGRLEVMAWC
jgi:hypothetical protein